MALKRLAWKEAAAKFVVVDQEARALKEAQALNPESATWIEAEAVAYLAENLSAPPPWSWVLPMVPVHVAYAWLRRTAAVGPDWQTLPVPSALEAVVPVSFRGQEGQLYLSRARHLCPDDCPEPPEGCPVSGIRWERPLFEELQRMSLPGWRVLVIPSEQLAPGIGGYRPELLQTLAEEVAQADPPAFFLIVTACRCHGVVHALGHGQRALSREPHAEGRE